MHARRLPRFALPLLLVLGALFALTYDQRQLSADDAGGADARGKEDGAEQKDGEAAKLVPPPEDKARDLIKTLEKAAKKRKPEEILPALAAIEAYTHEDFLKPLLKLARHTEREVALRAVALLEWRARDKKTLGKLLRAYDNKLNKRRYVLKGVIWRTFARAGQELARSEYRDFEKDWRWMWGNPDKKYADGAVAFAEAVALGKEKRAFRSLAEHLTNPNDRAIDVHSPTNPSADWHERYFYMWQPARQALVNALKALSGQEFQTTEQAKAWAEEHGKANDIEW